MSLANLSIAAEYRTEYGMLFAGIVLVTLPILVYVMLQQRQIVRGIAAGALKRLIAAAQEQTETRLPRLRSGAHQFTGSTWRQRPSAGRIPLSHRRIAVRSRVEWA